MERGGFPRPRSDVGHDVLDPGHAKGEDGFGFEVKRLDLVFQSLLRGVLLHGQELHLETGDEGRGKLGAVVPNPLDGIVGVLDVVDPDVEATVGLADEGIVLHFAVGAFGLEVLFLAFALPATVDGVLVVDPKLDIPGIDFPDLGSPEDGSEGFPRGAGLDERTGGGLGVEADELSATDGRVEHQGFECGVGEDGHW